MLLGENGNLLWLKLLRAKYQCNNFFFSNPTGGSPFWHSLHKLKHLFKLGTKFTPDPQLVVAFWTDLWVGEVPLSIRFPLLFDKCSDPLLKVGQERVAGNWHIDFRRNFGPEEEEQWAQLDQTLIVASFDPGHDKVSWCLEPSGSFSTRSMYKALCEGPSVQIAELLWTPSMPLKIKIFLRQLARGRLPSNDKILLRRGPSDGNCALCGSPEDMDHIFFNCCLAQLMKE
jgi:hypothetical protein